MGSAPSRPPTRFFCLPKQIGPAQYTKLADDALTNCLGFTRGFRFRFFHFYLSSFKIVLLLYAGWLRLKQFQHGANNNAYGRKNPDCNGFHGIATDRAGRHRGGDKNNRCRASQQPKMIVFNVKIDQSILETAFCK